MSDREEGANGPIPGHQFVNSNSVERISAGNVHNPDSFPAICPDISLSTQEERELQFHDWATSEGPEINTQPPEGCSFLGGQMFWRKDEEYQAALVGLPEKGVEHSAGRNSAEHEVISFIVKEEQEASSFNSCGAKNRQSVHKFTAHDGITSKQRKVNNAFQNREKISTCKISSSKTNMDVTITSETEPRAINQLQSKGYLEFGTENASGVQMGFRNPAHINTQSSESYEKNESNVRDAHFLSCLRKTNPVERLHSCSECKRCFSHKAVLVRHLRTHSRVRPYACTECKKSFFKKGDFTRHRRTHTGEKPFMCIDCHKRFNRKGNLDQHRVLIHFGVRPFKCSECEKCFSRQCDLAKHITKHQQKNNIPLPTSVQ